MKWTRIKEGQLVSYVSDDGNWRIEQQARVSVHGGMVYGRHVSDADERKPRVTGYSVIGLRGYRTHARTLAAAKAAVERRVNGA